MARDTRTVSLLALAGILGPLGFTTLVVLQGILQPDYSPIAMPISALAAWPKGWIQNLNFYVFGFLTAAFAFGLDAGVAHTRHGWIGIALLVLGAVGVVVAGLFPWIDVNGSPIETPQHVVGAVMTFVCSSLGLLVFSRRLAADSRWRDLAEYTLVTGIVMLTLFVVLGGFAIEAGTPLHPWTGLLQRVICLVWSTCMIVLALRLRKAGSAAPA